MIRNRLSYLIVLTLFVLFSGSVSGGEAVDKNLEREILETFAEYQGEAISGSKHLARFFSKEINEIWLNWLLEKESKEKLLITHRAIRNRASFGTWIKNVYEYEVLQRKGGTVVLRLIYEIPSGEYYTDEIIYVRQSGKWLMNTIKNDSTRPGKNYSGRLIKDFPQSVLKNDKR